MKYRTYQVIEVIGDKSRYLCTFDGDELPETLAYALMQIKDHIRISNMIESEIVSVGETVENDTEYLSGYYLYNFVGEVVLKIMIEAYR